MLSWSFYLKGFMHTKKV